jgi:hypothetical protein
LIDEFSSKKVVKNKSKKVRVVYANDSDEAPVEKNFGTKAT